MFTFNPVKQTIMTAQNKRLTCIIAAVPLLLLIPLIAMRFTTEVDWDGTDFFIMGMLLLVTGLSCELALRKLKTTKHRLLAVGVILLLFLLVWGELATGYFRSTLFTMSTVRTTLFQPSFLYQ
jgi:ABC-type cobalt transport system substrate-binding protein